jgi:hypothetical protein
VELASVIDVLVRRRRMLALGFLFAMCAAIFTSYRVSLSPPGLTSRSYETGTAAARVVVDTPESQFVKAAPRGAELLPQRAQMLVDELLTSASTAAITHGAGLPSRSVALFDPVTLSPIVATPLPDRASQIAEAPPVPNVLAVHVSPTLPLVALDAAAPDTARATRLVDAAVRRLEQLAQPPAGAKPTIVIDRVTPTHAKHALQGPGHKMMLAVFVFLFGMWCAALVLASAVRRGRRRVQTA